MSKKKIDSKKPQMNREKLTDTDHGLSPLALAVVKELAKIKARQSKPFIATGKGRRDKGQGALIASWQCFYLNNIMVKYLLYGKDRGSNGK